MKTAIIGTGLIGRAWAISFARAGNAVRLWDAEPSALPAALDFIRIVLPDLEKNDLLNGASPDEVLSRIRGVPDLSEALADVDYVQENTPENIDIKRKVFADLDRHAPPSAILASSTSALLPSQFLEHVSGRGRCLVCHPINPPYLIPAAEVVPSPWTLQGTVDRAAEFLRSCGQAPLVMKREIDGFIMNRLQGALLEEAFRLVADGYAGVEDVDIGIRDGLALRWSFMGPFETIDLNAPGGVRDYAERYQQIYSRLFPSMQRRVDWTGSVMNAVEEERSKRLERDKLAERQMWRDRRLMSLLAHKTKADREIGS
ncbi:3-hydroxyacyl-CoA dehydrogenase [Microvirga aerilata]|uniref:3-hydroxyacyl-CoA dehydrogenase n=1 Tax=Microvirga aerilata TaxID=670292 RepID=A0A936ZM25_9HYPH|nr:3-hydroxyacyl-CoA dehydrogenase [Microvirga aerilata]MBL0407169.1 3-hydroxyacyl-CoA dehydrogenase [Microvirga aerilata]